MVFPPLALVSCPTKHPSWLLPKGLSGAALLDRNINGCEGDGPHCHHGNIHVRLSVMMEREESGEEGEESGGEGGVRRGVGEVWRGEVGVMRRGRSQKRRGKSQERRGRSHEEGEAS
uniref:Uncharacterized protein n=1 Tax=Knipowitschia caucasica TaxID=637954 RepID=A0AAV2MGT1_KNICA